jgi:hypothetical protein
VHYALAALKSVPQQLLFPMKYNEPKVKHARVSKHNNMFKSKRYKSDKKLVKKPIMCYQELGSTERFTTKLIFTAFVLTTTQMYVNTNSEMFFAS